MGRSGSAFPRRGWAVEVADEANRMLGGQGCTAEFEVERFQRDARSTEICEGTSEIQENTIAFATIGGDDRL